MHYAVIARILGVLLMLFSLTMLPPILVSILYADGATQAFITAMIVILASFLLLGCLCDRFGKTCARATAFDCVFVWLALGAAGTLPLMLAAQPGLSFADAF